MKKKYKIGKACLAVLLIAAVFICAIWFVLFRVNRFFLEIRLKNGGAS